MKFWTSLFILCSLSSSAFGTTSLTSICQKAARRATAAFSPEQFYEAKLANIELEMISKRLTVKEVEATHLSRKRQILSEMKRYLELYPDLLDRPPPAYSPREANFQKDKLRLLQIQVTALAARIIGRSTRPPYSEYLPDSSLSSQLGHIVALESPGFFFDTPLRAELRERYELMSRGEWDWPTDPKVLTHFGLSSYFAEPHLFHFTRVEAYLDYEEIRALETILHYVKLLLLFHHADALTTPEIAQSALP